MMSPLGEDEDGRGLYKVVTAAEEGLKQNEPNRYVCDTNTTLLGTGLTALQLLKHSMPL